jgi:hypothetical protein
LKRIEIYTKGYCPYCQQTKELLESKKVPIVEYDVTNDPVKKQAMPGAPAARRSRRSSLTRFWSAAATISSPWKLPSPWTSS